MDQSIIISFKKKLSSNSYTDVELDIEFFRFNEQLTDDERNSLLQSIKDSNRPNLLFGIATTLHNMEYPIPTLV